MYFAPPIQRSLHQLLPRRLFPCFRSSFDKNRLALRWGMRAKESQEEERRAVESVKCLRGTRDGGRHLTDPNVCVRYKCRICKLFLIKRKSSPAIFLLLFLVNSSVYTWRLPWANANWFKLKKDKILSDLMFYSYPKQLDAMIGCISALPVKSFWTVRFWMFYKELSSAHQACIYLILNTAKALYCEIVFLFKITSILIISILIYFKM